MKLLLTILAAVVLTGCVPLHESFCSATLKHYQTERTAEGAQVYYQHYKETCE